MMKNMDPEVLSNMLKSSGMNITPDQVKLMSSQMDNLSEKQLERLAQISSYVGSIYKKYQQIRSWIQKNFALFLALIFLLLALLLRWKG